MTATLLLLLKASVGVIIFAIGMDSTVKDAGHLFRRPGLLLRSVLAMYVLVPLAAFVLVKLLTLWRPTTVLPWPWPVRHATSALRCWWPHRCPGRARR